MRSTLNFSVTTGSRVIRTANPIYFHSLHVLNKTSGQTLALVATGTSGTWTASKILVPKYTRGVSVELGEVLKVNPPGILCDGLWIYFPHLSGSTAIVVWS